MKKFGYNAVRVSDGATVSLSFDTANERDDSFTNDPRYAKKYKTPDRGTP